MGFLLEWPQLQKYLNRTSFLNNDSTFCNVYFYLFDKMDFVYCDKIDLILYLYTPQMKQIFCIYPDNFQKEIKTLQWHKLILVKHKYREGIKDNKS